MITLTDWKTHEPVMLDSKEIGAVKVVGPDIYKVNGIQYSGYHSRIFIISDSGMYDHAIDVCELPENIGLRIMAPLLEAGEQIRI